MISLGKMIQRARQVNSGMTQAEAARAAGFRSKVWWGQIEEGVRDPPPDTAARMARIVGLTPGQLRKAGQEDAACELAEILDIFGPFVGDGADRELVARIGALSEEQRKALFTLLKLFPAIPIDLVTLLRWRPRPVMVASSGAAALAAALAIWLPGPSTDGPAQSGVSQTHLKRGPSAAALRPSPPRPQRGPSGSGAPGAPVGPGGGRSRSADLQLEASTVKVRASLVPSVPPLPSLPVQTPRGMPAVGRGTTPVVGPGTPVGGGRTARCAGAVALRLVVRVCHRLPLG